MTPQNVSVGFKKAGIWPFNPDAVTQAKKVDKHRGGTNSRNGGAQGDEDSGNNGIRSDGNGGGDDTGNEGGCGTGGEGGKEGEDGDDDIGSCVTPVRATQINATPEQEERFQRHYEEGYDIYDAVYITWLELNHSEHLPPGNSTSTPNTISGLSINYWWHRLS